MQGSYYPSAGVYVREADLSQRAKNVASSIGAVVGASAIGPLMERTLITSIDDFLASFGKPNPAISYMHYVAIEFLKESGRLYVTRVAHDDALTAGAYLSADDNQASIPVLNMSNFGPGRVISDGSSLALELATDSRFSAVTYSGGALRFTTLATGAAAAITVTGGGVVHNEAGTHIGTDAAPAGAVAAVPATPGTLNITITDGDAATVNGFALNVGGSPYNATGVSFAAITDGASLAAALAASPSFASVTYGGGALHFTTVATGVAGDITVPAGYGCTVGGTPIGTNGAPAGGVALVPATPGTIIVTITDALAADAYRIGMSIGGAPLTIVLSAAGKQDPLHTVSFSQATPGIEDIIGFFTAASPGAWNNNVTIKIRPSTRRGQSVPDDNSLFYVDVFINYTGTGQAPNESWLVCLDYRQDGFGQQMQIEEVINVSANKSQIVRFIKNPYVATGMKFLTATQVTLEGGDNGGAITDGDLETGWDLYSDTEGVDVNILINAGYTSQTIQQYMATLAATRRDCIAILDMPSVSQSTSAAITYRNSTLNVDSSFAAIYAPDLLIRDPYNDRDLLIPPSGHIASVYARTDKMAELWFAPAGMNRGFLEVKGVRTVYNQGARDAFAEAQINPIRVIPGSGFYVWGADTLQSMSSALSNVNVRRLMNYLEKSIAVASLYSVFDPNDIFLWMKLRDICETFLKPIRAGRGLYWYDVICDENNNKANTIAAGDVNLDVYVDPVIPAKRIHLNAVINKTGIRFTESSL